MARILPTLGDVFRSKPSYTKLETSLDTKVMSEYARPEVTMKLAEAGLVGGANLVDKINQERKERKMVREHEAPLKEAMEAERAEAEKQLAEGLKLSRDPRQKSLDFGGAGRELASLRRQDDDILRSGQHLDEMVATILDDPAVPEASKELLLKRYGEREDQDFGGFMDYIFGPSEKRRVAAGALRKEAVAEQLAGANTLEKQQAAVANLFELTQGLAGYKDLQDIVTGESREKERHAMLDLMPDIPKPERPRRGPADPRMVSIKVSQNEKELEQIQKNSKRMMDVADGRGGSVRFYDKDTAEVLMGAADPGTKEYIDQHILKEGPNKGKVPIAVIPGHEKLFSDASKGGVAGAGSYKEQAQLFRQGAQEYKHAVTNRDKYSDIYKDADTELRNWRKVSFPGARELPVAEWRGTIEPGRKLGLATNRLRGEWDAIGGRPQPSGGKGGAWNKYAEGRNQGEKKEETEPREAGRLKHPGKKPDKPEGEQK